VALLTLRMESGVPAGATLTIGDRPALALSNERLFAAPAGQSLAVHVRAPGYQPWSGTVTLERGRVTTLEVQLQRVVEGPRIIERTVQPSLVRVTRVSPVFRAGLAIGGAGLAAAVTGAVLFATGRGRYATLAGACTASACPQDPLFVELVDRGERLETAGQATLYAGVGVTLLGGVLALATLPRVEWVPAPRARARVNVGLGAIALGGSF
jgi:hypothetical protein